MDAVHTGGHTSEALGLLSALDFARYFPRTYILSEGDTLSMQKALDLESAKASESPQGAPNVCSPGPFSPRAREQPD